MGIDASAVLNTTTLNRYLKAKVEPISRESVLLGYLESRGRISYGAKNSGLKLDWRPRIRRRKIHAGDAYNTNMDFPSVNTRMKVELPWRRYYLGEKISRFDRLANRGSDVQLVNLYQSVIDEMAEDFREDFATKLYSDGNASGSKDIHGLESIFGVDSTPLLNQGYSPTCENSDTYAGKSTTLGALGGSWTGYWPMGSGDEEYCAWTPLIVDYTNSFFGQSTYTWDANWQQSLNFATKYMGRLQKAAPDLCLMDTELLRKAEDSLIANERFIATPKSGLTDLGFKTLTFKGLEIATEYSVPSDTAYLLTWNKIELRSMQDQLVGYDKDVKFETSEDLFKAEFWGNLQIYSPAHFGKLVSVTGT